MPGDPITRVHELELDDPARYTACVEDARLRMSPADAEDLAHRDPEWYHSYADRSCDLTMRGGTTSGVVYPLAVCALADHYVIRSVGGASAGAIAAAASAAAEYGRLKPEPKSSDPHRVRPGFAGLAQLVQWLISGDGGDRWRLTQLFQPHRSLHRVYRLAAAMMQKLASTGRDRYTAGLVALLSAVTTPARLALIVLFAAWMAAPIAQHAALPPRRWNDSSLTIAVGAVVLMLLITMWVLTLVYARLKQFSLVLFLPVVPWAVALTIWGVSAGNSATASGWLVAVAAALFAWLLVTFAVFAATLAVYLRASWPVIVGAEKYGYGLVPGAASYAPNRLDQVAGMARSTGVPPLSIWLADRFDDLAGLTPGPDGRHERALTFGDLWLGPDVPAAGVEQRAKLGLLAREPAHRVINLALMGTDLTSGKAYQLPFQPASCDDERWQFCERCLDGVLPERVIEQLKRPGSDQAELEPTVWACARHRDVRLRWMPEPWDTPVIVAARISLALPGLISAVPLHKQGRVHWLSDGGITSNFPIHFFDALLPKWPTFGLNLEHHDGAVEEDDEVFLSKQDSSRPVEQWTEVGRGVDAFAGRIFETFLGWRDTMQAALPGFRGRIAHVRQTSGEGGTNLFMAPETIAALALRGHRAGAALKHRFTAPNCDGEADGFTQTDRYRWIRMRIAMREYGELARQVRARAPLYQRKTMNYAIPAELAGWFDEADGPWPMPEPHTPKVEATFNHLGTLADTHLLEDLDGTSPVNPMLRLTPHE